MELMLVSAMGLYNQFTSKKVQLSVYVSIHMLCLKSHQLGAWLMSAVLRAWDIQMQYMQ